MKNRALIVASVAYMIGQFNIGNIKLLLENDYEIEVACNCIEGSPNPDERTECLIRQLESWGVVVHHVPIPKKISKAGAILSSIRQIRAIIKNGNFTLMHCHSPIGSVIARIAAAGHRKKGLEVIYTAHGFHFYKGAPKKNWLLFFPVEWLCSWITDTIITINHEDYYFSKEHLHPGRTCYIPGVGIDVKKYSLDNAAIRKCGKRNELGLGPDDIMIISLGELNKNKNHKVMIEALSLIKNENVHYFIAGKGDLESELRRSALEMNVNVHLLGYRTDIPELLNAADIYAFPSYREGLSLALMEAMAGGLPCVVSRIRGNTDLISEGKGGILCDPRSRGEFADALVRTVYDPSVRKRWGVYNQTVIERFSIDIVSEKMKEIYGFE